jgi:hypothetical protein
MSTVQDVLTILRSHGDNPHEMEQVLMDLPKEEQVKLKNLRVTLIDQLDCPQQCKVLADYYEMMQIAEAPQTETDKPADNDWRIYLWGMARRTNKHLIEWCLDAVKEGRLPKRIDSNGQLYLYINDLLPYKEEFYKTTVQSDTINIMSILSDSIIARGEVKKLIEQIMQDGATGIQSGYLPNLRAGRLGYVANYNPDVIGPYLQAVGLGDWL